MIVWRIGVDGADYLAEDLSGKGAQESGGRWNRKGEAVVYASSTIALAVLETVVHIATGELPLNRYLIRLAIPDDLWAGAVHFDPASHVGWDAEPAGKVSLDFGSRWLTGKASALAIVPSVIVQEEMNVLINPQHADAARITATKLRKFVYDRRLGPVGKATRKP